MSKLQSRYVGARPFETDQQLIFKGRQADTEAVFRLIQLESLTVLYGKSGTGKSSLLNAGIIPKTKAETDLLPVRVRFNAYMEGNAATPPALTARLSVRGGAKAHSTFLDKLIADEDTLWHEVKEHYIRHEGKKGLLLVIDQFEELFTYPPAQVQAFAEQLAEALFKTVPQRYWDVLESRLAKGEHPLTAAELSLLQHKPALKVVLSIRSDRVHLLNRLDAQLPVILKNLYELDALPPDAARQAITEPAAMPKMDWFDTEPFLYNPTAIDHILDFLTLEKTEEGAGVASSATLQKIEATQLQIICAEIEKRVKARNLRMVQVADVGDLEVVIEQYYSNQILSLDPAEQLPARRLIEEGLVFEEEERRLSLYEGQIFKTYKIQPETLRKLVDAHLLRAEPSLAGGYTYELSHDTLVAPVLKAKRERLEEERQESEKAEIARKEQELKILRDQAELEKLRAIEAERLKTDAENQRALAELAKNDALQGRKRARIFTFLTGAVACVAIGVGVFAWQKNLEARTALKQALAEKTQRVGVQTLLIQALEEKIQRYDLEIATSLRKIEIYKKAKEPELVELESAQMQRLTAQRDTAQSQIKQINREAGQ